MIESSTIIQTVCDFRGLSLDEIDGPERSRRICWPRQEAAYMLNKLTSLNLSQIGRILGRDHTTIIHSIRSVEVRSHQSRYKNEILDLHNLIVPVFTSRRLIFKSKRNSI